MKNIINRLANKNCIPCEGKGSLLNKKEISQNLAVLSENWYLANEYTVLCSDYKMKNFEDAVDFINKIAYICKKNNHHPDLHLTNYNNLHIDLKTHALAGLSENDFIIAAKIDELRQ